MRCVIRSGLDPITTSSPHNFDYLKSLGATEVFDYKSPTVGADIRKYTKNKLYYAFDCFSEKGSPAICAAALSSDSSVKKPEYGAILGVPPSDLPRDDVIYKVTLGKSCVLI